MAASVVQRPQSVGGISHLPVIQHPTTRLGSKRNLNVRGLNGRNLSSASSTRSEGADPSSDFPSLREKKHSRNPTWPSGQRNSSSADPFTRKRIDPQKLYTLIQRQLSSHFKIFQQHFRANDPLDRGIVSKGAFSRILYQLVGYVAIEDVGRFLEWLNIDSSNGISFSKFVSAFQDDRRSSKRWMTPLNQQSITDGRKKPFPEDHLRRKIILRDRDYVTASYANAFLKEKCKHSDFHLLDHLSTSCFEPGAHVLPPQLSDCLESIGVPLDNEEMMLLWSRYDLQNTGSLEAAWFFERIGLEPSGCHFPRARTAPPRTSGSWGVEAGDRKSDCSPTPGRSHSRTRSSPASSSRHDKTATPELPRPPSGDVISSLMRKMEQNYYALLVSCQRLDEGNNGLISKAALMGVLRDFGIPMHPLDMEELLGRCHSLRKDQYVCFQDFLFKFMTRSSQGVAHRVMTDPAHRFSHRKETPAGYLSAEDAEAKLVEMLQRDFLRLLGTFKSLDPHSLHLTTQLQFREAVNKVFNMRVTDRQFTELLQEVGTTQDGLVPYPEFLAIFNKKRSLDPHSLHLTTQLQFREAVNKVFNMRVTDRQFTELLQEVGTTQDGLVPYPEFLANFNKKRSFLPTNARGNVPPGPPSDPDVAPEAPSPPSSPPHLHQEITQGERSPPPMPIESGDNLMSRRKSAVMEGRYQPVHKIARIVQHQLNTKRAVAKEAFERLDAKNSGYINRTQLHYWLQALGVVLHPTELQSLWRALQTGADGLVHRRELLEFFTKEERRKPFIEDQILLKEAKSTFNDPLDYLRGVQRSKVTEKQDKPQWQRDQPPPPDQDILGKIRPQVLKHWDELKSVLQESDPEGCGIISIEEFKNVCHFLQFDLSETQLATLCDQFDFDKNNLFHYLQFMKMFASLASPVRKPRGPDTKYNRDTHRIVYEGSQGAVEESVSSVLHKIRRQLTKEWKNLRRAFKQADLDRDGYLSVVEFKACAKRIIRDISDDDLFYVLSELDANMDGKISYDEFLVHLRDA